MTIGFSELAVLAFLVAAICWIPAPVFVWHRYGRWFVLSTSILVMLASLAACGCSYLRHKLCA